MKNYLLLLISFGLISVGCYKDTDDTPPTEVIIEIADVFVNTSISGSVIDLEGNKLTEYNLIVNDQLNIIPSDYFLLQLEDLKKKGQTIHVFKDEKKIGIRTQLLIENDINHMEILQHPEYNYKTIVGNDQQIDLSNSLMVDFSNTKWAGDFKEEISVEYVYIQNSNSLTPVGYTPLSDLVAVDSKGGFYLKTFDNNKVPLKAQPENPIILSTTNLEEGVNSLFLFDEEKEIWVLVTDFIIGDDIEILGEGYYTFAKYASGVFVEGKVIKEDKAVAYQPMQWDLSSISNHFCATEKGRWIALLPEKESVEVILLNPCDESLHTETLDIKIDDISNQNLIITNSDNYQLLDVAVLDCKGEIINQPNFNVSSGESPPLHYIFSEEYPTRWIAVCDEFEISAGNDLTGEFGPKLKWSTGISGGLDFLTDCSEFEQGFSYIKIRDEAKMYPAFEFVEDGDRSILKSKEGNIKFIFRGNNIGMYEVNEVNVFFNDSMFGEKGYYVKCENSNLGCGIDKFNVTHFSSSEEVRIIRVSFSGTIWMQTISPSVAGNFDIEGLIEIRI